MNTVRELDGIVWAKDITDVPTGAPECGWEAELCVDVVFVVTIAVPLSLVVLIVIGGGLFYYIYRYSKIYSSFKNGLCGGKVGPEDFWKRCSKNSGRLKI